MATPKTTLQRLEVPLVLILLAVLGVFIWRPWHRPHANGGPENIGANAPCNSTPQDGAPGACGRKDGDFGSFHQSVKPEQWANVDSAGRLTGSALIGRPGAGAQEIVLVVSGWTLTMRSELVAGARITATLYDFAEDNLRRQGMAQAVAGYSDKKGVFRIGLRCSVPAKSTAFVTLSAEGGGLLAARAEGFIPTPGEVKEVALRMVRPSALVGEVLDDEGNAIAGAMVQVIAAPSKREGWPERLVEPNRTLQSASTDRGGVRFENLAAGDYAVSWFKQGYTAEQPRITVALAEGETRRLPDSLVLKRVAELRLRVVNMDAAPSLVQIMARFYGPDGEASRYLLQAQEGAGRFAGNLAGLAAGRYRIELYEYDGRLLKVVHDAVIKARETYDLGDIHVTPE